MAAGAQETPLNSMGAYVKANSVDGDTTARIGDERFGLVHEAGLALEELQQKIGDFTREADPTGGGIGSRPPPSRSIRARLAKWARSTIIRRSLPWR